MEEGFLTLSLWGSFWGAQTVEDPRIRAPYPLSITLPCSHKGPRSLLHFCSATLSMLAFSPFSW